MDFHRLYVSLDHHLLRWIDFHFSPFGNTKLVRGIMTVWLLNFFKFFSGWWTSVLLRWFAITVDEIVNSRIWNFWKWFNCFWLTIKHYVLVEILLVRNIVIAFGKYTVSAVLRSLVDQSIQSWCLNIAFIRRVLGLILTGDIILITFESLHIRCHLIRLKPVVLNT